MALYVVERDLGSVAPEQLRQLQQNVVIACRQLKSEGNRIRYISSAVVPADALAVDLFGSESVELVERVHVVAGVAYSRIVEILDLTPRFLARDISRPRRSLHRVGRRPAEAVKVKGPTHPMTANSPELARWLADGQRLFGVCLETLENSERLETRNQTLESENEMLREELARLRHKVDMLQTDRAEMVAAFNDLAGHVTQVVDHILQKSEDGENSK
jgi:hypothetical protein